MYFNEQLIHFYLQRVKYFEFIIKIHNVLDNGIGHVDALSRLMSAKRIVYVYYKEPSDNFLTNIILLKSKMCAFFFFIYQLTFKRIKS